MRLARRTRRRGALDKALALTRARAARLAAGPPLPPRAPADPLAPSRLRRADPGVRLVRCEASEGRGYDSLDAARRAEPDAILVALDLFLEPSQIRRAREAGADAVCLVARVLTQERLAALAGEARSRGLAVCVEVRTALEVAGASAVQADAVYVAEVDRDSGRPDPSAGPARAAAVAAGLPVIENSAIAGETSP